MADALTTSLLEQGFTLIETHISRVYLRDRDVYKTKRAVELGFLDFSTLEARRLACEAEVELNRRLARDVYLGVVAIVGEPDTGLRFVPAAQAEGERVLEWAVHMKRLDDAPTCCSSKASSRAPICRPSPACSQASIAPRVPMPTPRRSASFRRSKAT